MTCKITVAGKNIEVVELTVRDIREWFKRLESIAKEEDGKDTLDFIDWGLFESVTFHDIIRMTKGLTKDDLDEMKPSEIEEILAKVREINPHFFAMKKRVEGMGSAMLELGKESQKQ